MPLASGNHLLAIHGLEGSCDGPQAARFRLGAGSWTDVASTDGLNAQHNVPEPATPTLVLAALAVVAWWSRRGLGSGQA